MAQDRWTPGFRPIRKAKSPENQIKKLAVANVHTTTAQVGEVRKGDSEVDYELNSGITPEIQEADVILSLSKGIKSFNISLTNLREDELDILKEAIDFAFDIARPVVQKRDTVARKAREDGDNSYRRLHRGTPVLSHIRRPSGPDDQALRIGPPDVLPGSIED